MAFEAHYKHQCDASTAQISLDIEFTVLRRRYIGFDVREAFIWWKAIEMWFK